MSNIAILSITFINALLSLSYLKYRNISTSKGNYLGIKFTRKDIHINIIMRILLALVYTLSWFGLAYVFILKSISMNWIDILLVIIIILAVVTILVIVGVYTTAIMIEKYSSPDIEANTKNVLSYLHHEFTHLIFYDGTLFAMGIFSILVERVGEPNNNSNYLAIIYGFIYGAIYSLNQKINGTLRIHKIPLLLLSSASLLFLIFNFSDLSFFTFYFMASLFSSLCGVIFFIKIKFWK